MAEVIANDGGLPVIQIKSDDGLATECETCYAGDLSFDNNAIVPLSEVRVAASSGCQNCELRLCGIRSVTEAFRHPPSDDLVMLAFDHSLIKVEVTDKESRSRSGNPSLYYYIKLFTPFGQPTSPLPCVQVGRDIERTRRETYARIISEWIQACKEHENCVPTKGGSFLPSRVIDVSPNDSSDVALHVSTMQKAPYTALSHCWGKGTVTITTKNNYAVRQQCIRFSELPRTFQDAVLVTRSLGIKYLWIDSLCIIQDDVEDWQTESGKMADVYSDAYLVIGANRSFDCNGGFLDPQNRTLSESRKIAIIENLDRTTSDVYARHNHTGMGGRHGNYCNISEDASVPLAKRAWCLQEQLLSPRVVHFTDRE
jgi:hypothetical protein